ncbi:hypothetical protein [Pedobacter rhizosphaerae]|uniref:Uncharacterized protein n=1 Tax=Pedobacter rhizosphaerae TaxID=390241 RepID=A0A1H9UAV1_9SPHI|nr:hypothetical protein [Pedobacter rhizosphaerae]SES06462.1 hypothetical protein SAMN04488023_12912 [Pedobacter rhizosphaerae]
MSLEYFKKKVERPIVSIHGSMAFTFIIQTDNTGIVNAYDSDLGVTIKSDYELYYDEAQNLIIHLKDYNVKHGNWVGRGISCNVIFLVDNLKKFESAYDLVGE